MRTTIKPILGAMLAVLLLSVVASASASAACTKKAGATHDYVCITGKGESWKLGSEKEAQSEGFASHLKAGTQFNIEAPLGETSVHVACEGMNTTGLFESGGATVVRVSSLAMHFEKCKIVGEWSSRCEVTVGTWETKGHTGGRKSEPALVGALTLTREGTWGIISFYNKGSESCQLKSVIFEPKGALQCVVGEVEVEKVTKEVACKSEGEFDRWSEDPLNVSFESTMELSGKYSGDKFSIYQGT